MDMYKKKTATTKSRNTPTAQKVNEIRNIRHIDSLPRTKILW